MNKERKIPDPATRARNVERLKEVCLMFDNLNMMLEQASAIAEADLQNSPLYVHRRERVRKQLEMYKSTQNPRNFPPVNFPLMESRTDFGTIKP